MSTISQVNKKYKINKKKLLTRIIVFILAILMVSGMLYYVIYFTLHSTAYAAGELYPDNQIVRVGLMYGESGVTVGFKNVADNGFSFGYLDSGNGYTQLWQVTDKTLSVTCDANLKNSAGTFSFASSSPDIGGYHIQLDGTDNTIYNSINDVTALLAPSGYQVFPSYINNIYCLRIGKFDSAASAETALSNIRNSGSEQLITLFGNAKIVSPTDTAVSVVNPSTNVIVFEFDAAAKDKKFGLEAVQNGSTKSYIKTPAGNIYDGVFEFTRYKTSTVDGVQLVNIVPLETYITGVIPYEIGTYWSLEAMKAFAVVVRSYALSHIGTHSSLDFDVCNGTHCQGYKGFGATNDKVRQAASQTEGMVITYNGKICSTFYSSSTGGCTVDVSQVWGSSQAPYPYLVAVATPWEKYTNYGNGSWTVSVTPEQLLTTLQTKGYTTLKGSIADVKIKQLANNSSYVYSITFTDTYGTSVTITNTDKIRTVLSQYVKSANFVVAKAGQSVTITDYTLAGYADGTSIEGLTVMTSGGRQTFTGKQTLSVMTGSGLLTLDPSDSEKATTSGGLVTFDMITDLSGYPTITGANGKPLIDILSLKRVSGTRTVTAEGTSGSFVFIGRGWGHGTGLSQWGMCDLADLGYDYQTIIKAYYTGIEFTYYNNIIK